jgi:broad specificity phosphatase PhoE
VRALATAESIRRATGAPVEDWPDLRERSFGALRGRPYAECPVDIFAPGFAPPEGETWDEFHARVERAWRRVVARAAETRGNLAVVSHGLVCASIASRQVGLGDRGAPPAWPNASLTILSTQPPHAIELLACAQHLGDLDASAGADGGAA